MKYRVIKDNEFADDSTFTLEQFNPNLGAWVHVYTYSFKHQAIRGATTYYMRDQARTREPFVVYEIGEA